MRKNPVCYSFFMVIIAAFIGLSGCRNCDFNKTEKTVNKCSEYNNQENDCQKSFEKDGGRCEFDNITKNCRVKPDSAPLSCEKMSLEQCRASKNCTYQDGLGKCVDTDPGLTGRCEVIQTQVDCGKDPLCQWDPVSLVCKDKAEVLP